jgi:hypothetical protein
MRGYKMNKKLMAIGIILVMVATIFMAVLPNVSAEEYKHEELVNTAYEGNPYKLKWDNLQVGTKITWDWYAENEGFFDDTYPVKIDFWLEDKDGKKVIAKDGYTSNDGEYTVKSAGKYAVVWQYYDEDAADDNIDLYYHVTAKNPASDDSGDGDGDESTPGFEAVGLIASITIAIVLATNKKSK